LCHMSGDSDMSDTGERRRRPLDPVQAESLRTSSSTSLQHLLASGATMSKRHNAWLYMSRLEQRVEGLDQDMEDLGRDQRHEDHRGRLAAEAQIEGIEAQAARDVRSADARCAARLKSAEERRVAQQEEYEARLAEAAAASEAKLAEVQRQGAEDLLAAEARRVAEVAMADVAARVSERSQKDARDRLCQVHGVTVATLREESASVISALHRENDAVVSALKEQHAGVVEALEWRMSAQAATLRDEIQAREKDFNARMARAAATATVRAAVSEEQALIDSEQASIALAEKTREWEQKCAEAARLTDELAASMASRTALVKEGQVLSEKAHAAEVMLGEEVTRLEALLAREQASRRADGERWSKKMQGLVGETERSVLVCVEVQKKCDLNQLENTALEAALSARAKEGACMSDDIATLWADLAIVMAERDYARHSYDAKLLENTALEITLSAKEQEAASLSEELTAERAARAAHEKALQTEHAALSASCTAVEETLQTEHAALSATRGQNAALESEVADLQQAVEADHALMLSACSAATTLNEKLLVSRQISDRLATAIGTPRDALLNHVVREWRRVLSTRRRAQNAARRWSTGLLGAAWHAWHRASADAASERVREQTAQSEKGMREEFSRREQEVYEGAQSLVSATQAHYESEMELLHKKLRIATLSPSSPGTRMVLEPAAPEQASGGGGGSSLPPQRLGRTGSAPAVEMSADSTEDSHSDTDSDADEFYDATPVTREMDEMLSDESLSANSSSFHGAAATAEEFEHLRRLLARRSGENARLAQELEQAKQVHRDSKVWSDELQTEVQARMTAEAQLAVEVEAAAAASATGAAAAARVKTLLVENAGLKNAEEVAFAELLELQAKFEDAMEAKELAEADLEERREHEMQMLAQINALQRSYADAEEAKLELETQLELARAQGGGGLGVPEGVPPPSHAEEEARETEREKQAELAGAGAEAAKVAAAAMEHALEIADVCEAEVVSVRKKLEQEVRSRKEQKQELDKEVVLRMVTEAELARLMTEEAGGGGMEVDEEAVMTGGVAVPLELDLTPRGTRAET
jgi:hypothetical protein